MIEKKKSNLSHMSTMSARGSSTTLFKRTLNLNAPPPLPINE